jgi:8-oxo-dGTP pyrophosphatase MutT (NUDIX family)
MNKWQVASSKLVLDNQWARVRKDDCLLPNGIRIADYYYWEGGSFAQVFALTLDESVVFVRQYKHGVKEVVLELPAGMISASDRDPLTTARRELREETGFDAEEWNALGTLNVSSAKADTRAFPFLARTARQVAQPEPDATEDIEVVLIPIAGLITHIRQGEIRDSNSLATCLLALVHLGQI